MKFRSKTLSIGLVCLLGAGGITNALGKSRHHIGDDSQSARHSVDSYGIDKPWVDESEMGDTSSGTFSSMGRLTPTSLPTNLPTGHRHHWHHMYAAPALMSMSMAIPALRSVGATGEDAAQCQAQGGTYLSGTIVAGPFFVRARQELQGVALSHTKIILHARQGQIYDIRADNVFAAGYDNAGAHTVPAPLSTLTVGDQLSLCGRVYKTKVGLMGMDWVHTNCGAPANPNAPNGWLKQITSPMVTGPNLEGSEEYCHLW